MNERAKFVGAIVSGLSLFGCGVSPPASVFPTADAALARMREQNVCVNGVQGTAKVDTLSPRGRIRGDVLIMAVNPDRVRFDVVSPFGATIYTLTSDGQRFQMLDMKEKQFLHGPASPCNLARMTQVPVPGHALVSLLRGEAPVLVHEQPDAEIKWDTGGFYVVTIKSKHNAFEEIHLEVHPDDFQRKYTEQRLRVTDVRVAQAAIDLYQVELANHEPFTTAKPRVDPEGIDDPIPPIGGACDAELPRSIRMRVPNTSEDVIFQYKEGAWNPPIIPGAFTQPVPGGVRKVFVDCDKDGK